MKGDTRTLPWLKRESEKLQLLASPLPVRLTWRANPGAIPPPLPDPPPPLPSYPHPVHPFPVSPDPLGLSAYLRPYNQRGPASCRRSLAPAFGPFLPFEATGSIDIKFTPRRMFVSEAEMFVCPTNCAFAYKRVPNSHKTRCSHGVKPGPPSLFR